MPTILAARRAPLALLAVAVGVVGACTDAPDPSPTVTVRGIYIESVYQGEAMMVDHEAIADRMPAMRMPFRVADPALLDGVAEGASVRLTLDSASLAVVGIETLPSGTDLTLETGNADGRGVMTLPLEPDEAPRRSP